MSKRIGLPVTLKMRHDAHYVETLTSFSGASVGRMIPIDKIRPNPDQPRKTIGDIRELTDSIREKGVLEPLLVRYVPREDTYYIISGERRYHASQAAGLHELPCIEKIADDAETLELALIENLQRKDLTAFEEADGLQRLADQFDYTHDDIAKKIGRARSSVTETLSLARDSRTKSATPASKRASSRNRCCSRSRASPAKRRCSEMVQRIVAGRTHPRRSPPRPQGRNGIRAAAPALRLRFRSRGRRVPPAPAIPQEPRQQRRARRGPARQSCAASNPARSRPPPRDGDRVETVSAWPEISERLCRIAAVNRHPSASCRSSR